MEPVQLNIVQRQHLYIVNMKKKTLFLVFGILIIIVGGIFLFNNYKMSRQELLSTQLNSNIEPVLVEKGYVECLVKTSDNVISKESKDKWSEEELIEDRKALGKQGYIVDCRDENWNEGKGFSWGNLEIDPKRFVIIKFLKSEFNESWLEPEYDYSKPKYINISGREVFTGYEILTERKYKIELDSFLTQEEIDNLRNISYNQGVNWTLGVKELSNVKDKVVYNNWSEKENDLVLHGSSGTFTVCPSGCNYTSLLTWEAGEDSDLTGTGACIANITEAFTESHAAGVNVNGFTTTANDYVLITTAPAARNNGTNSSGYKLIPTSLAEGNAIFSISDNYVYVDGISMTTTDTNNANVFGAGFNNARGIINNTVVYGIVASTFATAYWDDGTASNNKIVNSLAHNIAGGSTGALGVYSKSGNLTVYSSTIADIRGNAGVGYGFYTTTLLYVNNSASVNLSGGGGSAGFVNSGGSLSVGTSLDEDGTAAAFGVGNVQTAQAMTSLFVSPSTANYHIKDSSSDLYNNGINLSNVGVVTDIDGDARPQGGSYDIGMDELIVAGGDTCTPTSPLSGNYLFECSDNCDIRSQVINANGFNISVNGSGTFIYNQSSIFNYTKQFYKGQDSSNKCLIYYLP